MATTTTTPLLRRLAQQQQQQQQQQQHQQQQQQQQHHHQGQQRGLLPQIPQERTQEQPQEQIQRSQSIKRPLPPLPPLHQQFLIHHQPHQAQSPATGPRSPPSPSSHLSRNSSVSISPSGASHHPTRPSVYPNWPSSEHLARSNPSISSNHALQHHPNPAPTHPRANKPLPQPPSKPLTPNRRVLPSISSAPSNLVDHSIHQHQSQPQIRYGPKYPIQNYPHDPPPQQERHRLVDLTNRQVHWNQALRSTQADNHHTSTTIMEEKLVLSSPPTDSTMVTMEVEEEEGSNKIFTQEEETLSNHNEDNQQFTIPKMTFDDQEDQDDDRSKEKLGNKNQQPIINLPQMIVTSNEEEEEKYKDPPVEIPMLMMEGLQDDSIQPSSSTTSTPHPNIEPTMRRNKKPFIINVSNHDADDVDDQFKSNTKIIDPSSQKRVTSQSKTLNRSIPQMIISSSDSDCSDQDKDREERNRINTYSNTKIIDPSHHHKPSSSSSLTDHQKKSRSGFLNCAGCFQIIAGRIVHALNQTWHPDCFKCQHCNLILEHVAFYEHDGKAYCGVDYDELFSLKCYHCNTSINEESYVTLDDPSIKDGPRHYHQLHLFCSECGDPFIDPKSLEELSKISKSNIHHQKSTTNLINSNDITHDHHQQNDELKKKIKEPKPFILHKGFPYCEKCDNKLHRPKCFRCKLPILFDHLIINSFNKNFHDHCFVCFKCEGKFHNNKFFLISLDQFNDLLLDQDQYPQLDSKLDQKHNNFLNLNNQKQVPICLNCFS